MKPWIVLVHVGGWRPEEVERAGLTGAEEVVTYMTRELALIGYRVAVVLLGDAGPDRIVNGVRYTNEAYLSEHWRNDPLGERTTLIVSMYPNIILEPAVSKLRVLRRVFWAHSIRFDDVKVKTFKMFDLVVGATEWQTDMLYDRYQVYGDGEKFPGSKTLFTIPYGINVPPPLPKVPGKCLYASSPDRGLLRLLRWWPAIKAECPDLTLYVTYGRDRMKERAKADPKFAAEVSEIDRLLEENRDTVTDLGFVSKPEMDRHLSESEYWLYPTDFEETGCLIGRKAVSAGAKPIYFRSGCLDEVLVPNSPCGGNAAGEFAFEAMGNAILHNGAPKPISIESWAEVAARWDKLLDPQPLPA